MVNRICSEVIEQEPKAQRVIAVALKEYTEGISDDPSGEDVLSALGYRASDFPDFSGGHTGFLAAAGLLTGLSLFFFTFLYRNRAENRRIRALTGYLEQVNDGKAPILSASGEDDFSRLEDEIYKTVTFLYQTREYGQKRILRKIYLTSHTRSGRRSRLLPWRYRGGSRILMRKRWIRWKSSFPG